MFFCCIHVKCFWERLQTKFQNGLILLSVASQTVILALYDKANIQYNLLSHIFLILRYCICKSREKRILNIRYSNCQLNENKKRQKQISLVANKTEAYQKNDALQITFYQELNNTLWKAYCGWEQDFLFVYLFVYLFWYIYCLIYLTFFCLFCCLFIWCFAAFSSNWTESNNQMIFQLLAIITFEW